MLRLPMSNGEHHLVPAAWLLVLPQAHPQGYNAQIVLETVSCGSAKVPAFRRSLGHEMSAAMT